MEYGKIKFELERGGELNEIAHLFYDLEVAYNALFHLQVLTKSKFHEIRYRFPLEFVPMEYLYNFEERPLLPKDTPELSRIEIKSPGWAEIVGALNPLQQIREYLKDRHERKIDKDWRSEAKKDRARLENELLQVQVKRENVGVIKEFYDLLEVMDIPKEEKERLLWSKLGEPLTNLGKHQDAGLLGDQSRNEKQIQAEA